MKPITIIIIFIIAEAFVVIISFKEIIKSILNELSKKNCKCVKGTVVSIKEERDVNNSFTSRNVWEYEHDNKICYYESKISSSFSYAIGTESNVYIKKNGMCFVEKENRRLLCLWLIFFLIFSCSLFKILSVINKI